MFRTRQPFLLSGIVALLASTVCYSAYAHFVLDSPPASTEQNSLGNPQKAPPCGDDGSATPTSVVTTYQAGQTITVTIDETIFHPGHYRIALAVNDPSELPAEPIVTPADTPCGSAPIMNPPVFPVLADGVFLHTQPFSGPQSVDITLPDDVTCDHCTLQIIQFMSDHGLNNPGGCYYHHCADIAIQSDPVVTTSSSSNGAGGGAASSSGAGGAASSTTGAGASSGDPLLPEADGGCSCSLPGQQPDSAPGSAALLGMLGLAAVALGRRRRH